MILFIGDGMGEPEITLGRDYQLGAAGRFAGLDSTRVHRRCQRPAAVHETDPSEARLRPRVGADRKRLGDRTEVVERADLDAARRIHARQRPEDDPRARPGGGIRNRERLDRGDHRRHTGGARLARAAPRLSRPTGHGSLPGRTRSRRGGQGSIAEQTVDHGVDVVLGGGLRPLRRSSTTAGQIRRPDGHRTGGGARATGSFRTAPTCSRPTARRSSSGTTTPSTMTTEWNGLLAANRSHRRRSAATRRTEPAERAVALGDDAEGTRDPRRRRGTPRSPSSRASSSRSRERRSTSRITPSTRVRRSARRSRSTRRSSSASLTPPSTRTRWCSCRRTTRTRARSSRRRRRAPAGRAR